MEVRARLLAGVVVGLVVLSALGASLALSETSASPPSAAVLRADRGAAMSSCRTEMGAGVLVATALTVGMVRAWPAAPLSVLRTRGTAPYPHPHAFSTLPATQVVAWCVTRGAKPGEETSYVVAPGFEPLRMAVRHPLGSTARLQEGDP